MQKEITSVGLYNQVVATLAGIRNNNLSLSEAKEELLQIKQRCKLRMDRQRLQNQDDLKWMSLFLYGLSLAFRTNSHLWTARTLRRDSHASELEPFKRVQILIDEILLTLRSADPGREVENLPALTFLEETIPQSAIQDSIWFKIFAAFFFTLVLGAGIWLAWLMMTPPVR